MVALQERLQAACKGLAHQTINSAAARAIGRGVLLCTFAMITSVIVAKWTAIVMNRAVCAHTDAFAGEIRRQHAICKGVQTTTKRSDASGFAEQRYDADDSKCIK